MRNAGKRLRELLARPGALVAPGCHDALGARLAQAAGFEAVFLSGNAASAAAIGQRDLGLMTMAEVVGRAHGIASAVDVPVVCDADTGYGDPVMVARTVREFEAAGVAAIHIEDQANPKKCGAMSGVQLAPLDESCARLEAALAARTDPDFVIIARTDGLATDSFDEAIRRARAYAALGVDLVFVEDMRSAEDVANVPRALPGVPLMFDVFETWPWTNRPQAELAALGYKLIIYALSATLAYTHTLQELFAAIRRDGSTAGLSDRLATRQAYEAVLGPDAPGG